MSLFFTIFSLLGFQTSKLNPACEANRLKLNAYCFAVCILAICSVSYAEDTNPLNKRIVERLTADQNEPAWRAFNISTVENYVIPNYKGLATANSDLYLSTQTFCKRLSSPNTNELQVSFSMTKKAFHRSMDAWQVVQNTYFGPIEYGMRHHSIHFWPDKKNHIGRQLNKLIASQDETALTVDGFEKNSVSVKGLPAIERLLFNSAPLDMFKQTPFACEVLQGISRYLSDTANALHDEWVTSMLPQFKDAKQLDGYFEDDIDASTALLKTLVEPIEVIRDLKLDRPLGTQFDKVKFKRLESWRSKRSLTNLQLNIQSLESLFLGTSSHHAGLRSLLTPSEVTSILNDFNFVKQALSKIEPPLEEAILTESGYQIAKSISASLTNLHSSLESAITQTGIRLGFNSRDGD